MTIGLTNAFVKPKYTWNLNYYTGPANYNTQKGYKNLIDTTLLLTPNAKFNAYINYDYGQNRDGLFNTGDGFTGDTLLKHWQGIAFAAREQVTGNAGSGGTLRIFQRPDRFTNRTSIRTCRNSH